jgi:predicted Zn-dependent protease
VTGRTPPGASSRGPQGDAPPHLAEPLDALARRGLPEAEVYAKRGRTRILELTPRGTHSSVHREAGWAVRAGDDRRSLFATATGRPDPDGPGGSWPEADGDGLELPRPKASGEDPGDWREPADLDAPLVGEREGLTLLAALASAVETELPGARLLRATLTDGASEVELANSHGLASAVRNRAAHLRVEAALLDPPSTAAVETVVREARRIDPRATARRLADRLTVARDGAPPARDRTPLLLAPLVAARLLEGLLPLLVGPRGFELAGRLEDRRGRFAAPALTVRDDGRLDGAPLAAPADGEGVPTSAVTLIESGRFRQPLLAWHQVGSRAERDRSDAAEPARTARASGCARRPGWRDLPRPGVSHLYAAPDPETSVRSLLEGLARGYYLLDVDGGGTFDFEDGRFSLPVVGFAVDGGRSAGPVAGARITGGIGALLRGVEAVARDLTFQPVGSGLIGAPTLLVTGVEIQEG